MLVDHKKGGAITFSLRDQKLAIISADAKVNYDCDGAADACYDATRRNDEFVAGTVRRYNVLRGIYVCRNRLTHWSNPGVLAGVNPPSEQLDKALSLTEMYRNTVCSIPSSRFSS